MSSYWTEFSEDDFWSANITALQMTLKKNSMAELSSVPEEEEMIFNQGINSQQYLAIGSFPLFIVGMILTGISVYVYTRPYQRRTTVGYLLAFLSIFEFCFLLTSFQAFCLPFIPFSYSNRTDTYPWFKAYSEVYVYPLTHVTKYMCVCISVMITVQQWIAVFMPMEVRDLCNMQRTKRLLILSLLVSVFLSIPSIVEKKINKHNGRAVDDNDWKDNQVIQVIKLFDDNVFNAFIVFFVLFLFNVSIICFLKYAQFERMRMTSQSIKDRRTSIMLLAVLFAYVVTHFPSMLIEYADRKLQDGLHTDLKNCSQMSESTFHCYLLQIVLLRKEISNTFMCAHPIFSFADYMIFSEKYRGTVKSLFSSRSPSELLIPLQAV